MLEYSTENFTFISLEKIKAIRQKLKELYEQGLSEKQRIATALATVLILLSLGLWIYNLAFNSINSPVETEKKGQKGSIESKDETVPSNNPDTWNSGAINPVFIPPQPESQQDEQSLKYLPEIPNNPYERQKAQPRGPMDDTFAKIREERKNDPKYVLIDGFLFYLKQVADGKRAWNDYYRVKAAEYLGDAKARQLENEIKRINGDKALKIRNTSYRDFSELKTAIKKEMEVYIEKSAINQYLDHIQEIADDRYPMNDETINLGEVNLEKAWVDQILTKIRALKERKSGAFRARTYATIEELIATIKADTKNYVEIKARDTYLDYILSLSKKGALSDAAVWSGGYLLEQYHLETLSKFVNK